MQEKYLNFGLSCKPYLFAESKEVLAKSFPKASKMDVERVWELLNRSVPEQYFTSFVEVDIFLNVIGFGEYCQKANCNCVGGWWNECSHADGELTLELVSPNVDLQFVNWHPLSIEVVDYLYSMWLETSRR